ncbi:MAG: hypothetical protein HY319_13530, partial [Armatimonadetes bacterium]|nr:hypothetical protein [Armatimonadota bacterium]
MLPGDPGCLSDPGLVETRSATINGVAVNTTFNVDVTANPLTDVGAGDAYDSAL